MKMENKAVYQMCDSTSPTVPNNERLVILEERDGAAFHVGWFSAASGWWMALERGATNGEWRSITIGRITGWREIHEPND